MAEILGFLTVSSHAGHLTCLFLPTLQLFPENTPTKTRQRRLQACQVPSKPPSMVLERETLAQNITIDSLLREADNEVYSEKLFPSAPARSREERPVRSRKRRFL